MQYYQEEPRMNDRGLPGDAGKQFAQPPMYGGMPQDVAQPQMNYTGDNFNPDMTTNIRETEEATQFKLDGERILNTLQHNWLGYTFDSTCNKWIKRGKPLISDVGVGRLTQIVMPLIANVDHRLTNLEIDSINNTLVNLRQAIRTDLITNPDYRLDPNTPLDVATIKIILEQLWQCAESVLKRSLGGFTVRNTGHSETHTYQHQPQGGGGMFPSIFKKQ